MQTTRFRATAVAACVAAALASAAAEDRTGRVEVAGGGLSGDLAAVPEAAGGTRETFLWRSPLFATPFEFRIDEVAGITYPAEPGAVEAEGPFVRLRGGDVIAATVESLGATSLVVSVAGPDGPQRLQIARAEVEAIARTSGGGAYTGPTGLAGWEQTPAGSWRDEAGRIVTSRDGATVSRDVAAPRRARFDIQVSRERAAEFRISVAAGDKPGDDGYVLQAIDNDGECSLLLVRRSAGRAAIDSLPAEAWRGDLLRIVLFVDQERGRLAAMLPDAAGADGGRVTEVTLPPPRSAKPSGRFRLELTSGSLSLDKLIVTSWRSPDPVLRAATDTAVTTRSGSLEGYEVTSFDAQSGDYLLTRGGETKRLAAADADEIRFPDTDDAGGDAPLRVVLSDGSTLSGALVKVDDRAVWLARRGIDGAVPIPRDAIASIRSQTPVTRDGEPGGRVGTLVIGEDRLRGWLEAGGDGGLAWRPVGSVGAAAFSQRPDAEIEYVPRRPERKAGEAVVGGIGGMVNRGADGIYVVVILTEDGAAARDGRLQVGDRLVAVAPREKSRFVETKEIEQETVMNLLRGRLGTTVRLKVTDGTGGHPRDIDLVRGPINVGATGRDMLAEALRVQATLVGPEEIAEDRQAEYPAVVVLRSGDVAPCRIEAIDADTVRLRSPLAGGADAAAVQVPVELVKAVELIPSAASRALDKTQLQRLLTLPRMQRARPPTHLLRFVDGDYLRGRLVAVDDATVTFEVLDVVKQLPRKRVARIIWLHPEVTPPADAEPEPEPEPEGLVVQGVSADGRRMTLAAESVAGNTIHGRSRAFGESSLDLAHTDRLLIGDAIGRDGGELPFARWVLKPAAEPRALGKPDGK